MKLTKFFMPGTSYDDAYVYMGHLIVINTDRSINFYNLEQIVTNIESKFGDTLASASYLFSRQDWLNQKPFQKLLADITFRDAFNKNIDRLNEFMIQMKDHSELLPRPIQLDLAINSRDILDFQCYSRRMYLGTTDGFYHIDIDWKELQLESVVKRLDCACVSLSTAYGVVNASCAEDGLHSAYFELTESDSGQGNQLHRIAPASIKTSFP